MISADTAISRFRRDLTLGALLRGTFLILAAASLFIGPITGSPGSGIYLMIAIGCIWMTLGYRSAQGSRIASQSPNLIASGRYDEAETQIDAALRTFSIFKPVKLMSLHHLALLRHAQQRWQDSARLCQALLSQQPRALGGLSKPSTLLLIDDLLNLNDLHGAYAALLRLYQQPLSLAETLAMQHLQLDYSARVGAWGDMLLNVAAKVELAEMMPPSNSARAQAFLALAAQNTQKDELSRWLRDRAALLLDPARLVAQRPFLKPLWPGVNVSSAEAESPESDRQQSIEGSVL